MLDGDERGHDAHLLLRLATKIFSRQSQWTLEAAIVERIARCGCVERPQRGFYNATPAPGWDTEAWHPQVTPDEEASV